VGYEAWKGWFDGLEFPDEIVERKNGVWSAPRAEISPTASGSNHEIPGRAS
jgi:hypothetical protein